MNHISPKQLNMLLQGGLSHAESSPILAHMEQCEACALAFAELAEDDMPPMPPRLEEDILHRLKYERSLSSRREFYGYCLRVGAAVCASLVLIFSGGFTLSPPAGDIPSEKSAIFSCAGKIGGYFEQLLSKLNNLEVPFNADKEE